MARTGDTGGRERQRAQGGHKEEELAVCRNKVNLPASSRPRMAHTAPHCFWLTRVTAWRLLLRNELWL